MSSQSSKNIDFLPRSVKSSSKLRRGINSMQKKTTNYTAKIEDVDRAKFKPINGWNSQKKIKKKQGANELDSKYNVYKHGSPNFYRYNIQGHKANNIRNQVQTLDLPFIDNVIKQLNNKSEKQNNANMRDYDLYPNLMKMHQTHKFKELLSDKQELKDFLKWFETSYKIIEQKNIPLIKKFQQKQIVISAGFGEITQQVGHLSRPRSQILKMLWNKQNHEVQQIVQNLMTKTIQIEKDHLFAVSKIHQQYQEQIDRLKKQNGQFSKKYSEESFINKGYVNTLRCNRKAIRKYEILIKKLLDNNENLIQENLNLLDQNTKIIMNAQLHSNIKQRSNGKSYQNKQSQSSSLRSSQVDSQKSSPQLKYSQARVLAYRRMQIAQKKSQFTKTMKQIKATALQTIKSQSQKQVKQLGVIQNSFQLQQKKNSLYAYLQQRFLQYPHEKVYLRDDFFHQDDHNIVMDSIDKVLKRITSSKQVEMFLKNQNNAVNYELKDIGVNTSRFQTQLFDLKDKQTYFSSSQQRNSFSNDGPSHEGRVISLLGNLTQKWQEGCHHKIRQSQLKTRISLLNLQIEKLKTIGLRKNQVQQVNQQNCTSSDDESFEVKNQPVHKNIKIAHQQFKQRQILSANWESLHQRLLSHMNTTSQISTKMPRNPQKHLNTIFTQVWVRVLNNKIQNVNFIQEIYQAFERKQTNPKQSENKLFNVAKIVNNFEAINQICLVVSLLFKVSDKFKPYNHLIMSDVTDLYFDLFKALRCQSEHKAVNVCASLTNFQRLRSKQVQSTFQKYFSRPKLLQINKKLQQLIKFNQSQRKKQRKINVKQAQSLSLQVKAQIAQISDIVMITNKNTIPEMPLNSLLLYIIEIYLIQKEKYFSSYGNLVNFFTDKENSKKPIICYDRWAILLGFFNKKYGQKSIDKGKNHIQDDFYRFAILNDFPLLQERLIQAQICVSNLPAKTLEAFEIKISQSNQEGQLQEIRRWEKISKILENKISELQEPESIKGVKRLLHKMKTIIGKKQDVEVFSTVYKLLIWKLYVKDSPLKTCFK